MQSDSFNCDQDDLYIVYMSSENSLPEEVQTAAMPVPSYVLYNQANNNWNSSLTFHNNNMGLETISSAESEDSGGMAEEEINIWSDQVREWKAKRSTCNLQALKYLCFKPLAATAQQENVNANQLPLKILPFDVKQEFLEYLKQKSQRILGRFAVQLLEADSTYMDFEVVKFSKEQGNFVWNYMVDNCPNMTTVINRSYYGVPFTPLPIHDLKKLPKLEHIEMPDFWVNDEILAVISNHFPQLRVLHISILDLSSDGEGHLKKMKNLQVFDFHGSKLRKWDLERDVQIMSNLLVALPNLEVLWPSYPITCDHGKSLALLSKSNTKVFINLKKLRLCGGMEYWPDLVTKVEHLYLKGPFHLHRNSIHSLENFCNLQSLSINTPFMDDRILKQLLVCYGKNLKELMISVSWPSSVLESSHQYDFVVDLGFIFVVCTQLVKFHLEGKVNCHDVLHPRNPDSFLKLEDVKMRIFGEVFDSQMLNYAITYARRLKVLKLAPISLFLRSDLLHVLKTKLEADPQSFSALEELWLAFHSSEINYEITFIIKSIICRAPGIKRVVIESLRERKATDFCPFYADLALFCEYFMPSVDFVSI